MEVFGLWLPPLDQFKFDSSVCNNELRLYLLESIYEDIGCVVTSNHCRNDGIIADDLSDLMRIDCRAHFTQFYTTWLFLKHIGVLDYHFSINDNIVLKKIPAIRSITIFVNNELHNTLFLTNVIENVINKCTSLLELHLRGKDENFTNNDEPIVITLDKIHVKILKNLLKLTSKGLFCFSEKSDASLRTNCIHLTHLSLHMHITQTNFDTIKVLIETNAALSLFVLYIINNQQDNNNGLWLSELTQHLLQHSKLLCVLGIRINCSSPRISTHVLPLDHMKQLLTSELLFTSFEITLYIINLHGEVQLNSPSFIYHKDVNRQSTLIVKGELHQFQHPPPVLLDLGLVKCCGKLQMISLYHMSVNSLLLSTLCVTHNSSLKMLTLVNCSLVGEGNMTAVATMLRNMLCQLQILKIKNCIGIFEQDICTALSTSHDTCKTVYVVGLSARTVSRLKLFKHLDLRFQDDHNPPKIY
jgi:hypothetical protein